MIDMTDLFYTEHVNLDPHIEEEKRAKIDAQWTNTVFARNGRASTQYKLAGANLADRHTGRAVVATGTPFAEMRRRLRETNDLLDAAAADWDADGAPERNRG